MAIILPSGESGAASHPSHVLYKNRRGAEIQVRTMKRARGTKPRCGEMGNDREYGIPAVVGVKNGTKTIKTGRKITVDGTRGAVHIEKQSTVNALSATS